MVHIPGKVLRTGGHGRSSMTKGGGLTGCGRCSGEERASALALRAALRLEAALGPTHEGGEVMTWPSDGDRRNRKLGRSVARLTREKMGRRAGGQEVKDPPLYRQAQRGKTEIWMGMEHGCGRGRQWVDAHVTAQ
jgi:hypothetical protein